MNQTPTEALAPAVCSPPPTTKYIDSEVLGAEITELCSYIYAATYRLLVLIHEFDQKGLWQLSGICSCAHWLNFKCGIGINAAREKVRVANALADLPKISAAFARGALSYSKVRAMTRVADGGNEDYLLMIAKHGTAHHMEKLVSMYSTCKRRQEKQNANQQYANRQLRYRYDADGSLIIDGHFPPEQGALILKALELSIEGQFRESEQGEQAEVTMAPRENFSTRRADALLEVAESYLNHGPTSKSSADRYQVVVHVSAETLQETSVDDVTAVTSTDINADLSYIEDGPHVTAETSRRIACDGSITGLVEDNTGEPLSIGRKTRAIPPAMRRALRARDQGCRFPGCTNTQFIDGHHIKHWADGGETSMDNLLQLCRRHHRLVHEGGFGCERTPEGKIAFIDQRNVALPECIEPITLSNSDVSNWMQAMATEFRIDSHTCVPRWYAGERMDWDLGVASLFECSEKRVETVN